MSGSLSQLRVIAEVRYPSLALRGVVPHSEKDIPTVPIVHVKYLGAAGIYCFPAHEERQIGQRFYDMRRGLILVSDISRDDFEIGEEIEDSMLPHEWRHHWQYCNGYKSDSLGWPPDSAPTTPTTYDQQIRTFFRQSHTEMDALMYAWKVTGKIDARIQEAVWGQSSV